MKPEYYRTKAHENYNLKKHYSELYKTQSLPGETFTNFVKRMKIEEKNSTTS